MQPAKAQLRESLQEVRMALSAEDRRHKSNAIAASLLQEVYWSRVKTVHCFEPIMHLGEVDLVDFVTALQTDKADVRVYTSRKIDGEWLVVDTADDEPVKGVPEFDVIIVPMLGFDEQLHRVGYGGGYYDKFLADQPKAKKIGVCYEVCKVEQIPAEPHDIRLDMIVTDQSVYGHY
jgi:5-formyltetrahydrofolate cyclo-ligase